MAMVKKNPKLKQGTDFTPKLCFAIRIRGAPGMNHKIEDTLKMLRMHKVNHGVLLWVDKPTYGMLKKCKDYIAFGEIDERTLVRLLRVRGKIEGNRPLTDEHIKNLTKSIQIFIEKVYQKKINSSRYYKNFFLYNLSFCMVNNEENINNSKINCGNNKKIHCRNGISMIF